MINPIIKYINAKDLIIKRFVKPKNYRKRKER